MSPRVRLFGYQIDAVRMPEAVERILQWVTAGEETCRYVVTPNVDHTVLLQRDEKLRQAYADAAMVIADGMPIVMAARLLKRYLPERVAGSDLAPALFDAAAARGGLRIYLLGAGPGVAQRAAANIIARWPDVEVVGTDSPPLGFEHDARENAAILARIAAAQPDVVLVGLGAPKQERWVHAHRHEICAAAALCIGATIDFLAGHKQRAPVWMRKSGLEFLHRIATNPRRLLGRYLRDAWIFPQLLWREWASNSS